LKNQLFTCLYFWKWIIFGVWQSFFLSFATFYAMEMNFIDSNEGYNFIFWGSGMVIYGAVIVNTNLKVLIFSNTHSLSSVLIILGSILSFYWLYAITSEYVVETSDYHCSIRFFFFWFFMSFWEKKKRTWKAGNFYLLMFMLIVITTMFDMGFERYKREDFIDFSL